MMGNSLAGKAIVNTRAVHQAPELDRMLRIREARPIPYPCIDIAAPADPSALDSGLRALATGGFDWLLLTSDNAVQAVARRAADLDLALSAFHMAKLGVVGPKTADAAREWLGVEPALIPDEHMAEALAEALDAPPGTRIFLPQSDLARDALGDALRDAGHRVITALAYQTIAGRGGARVPALLAAREIDAVIFTSPSTVRNFLDRIAEEGGSRGDLDGVCLASIGPVTSTALEKAGLPIHVTPETYTLSDLLDALERHFETQCSEKTV